MTENELENSLKFLQDLVNQKNPIIDQIINVPIKLEIDNTNVIAEKFSKDFMNLVESFSQSNSVERCINLFNYIGIDPLIFVDKTKSKFKIRLYNKDFNDLKFFISYAQKKLPESGCISAFELIEKITTNFSLDLLSVWSHDETMDVEKFSYLWKNENLHIKNTFLKYSSSNPNATPLELLEQLNPNDKKDWYKFDYHYLDEQDKKRIYNLASYVELQNNLAENNRVPKKIKV